MLVFYQKGRAPRVVVASILRGALPVNAEGHIREELPMFV